MQKKIKSKIAAAVFLNFEKIIMNSAWMKQFSPNFNSIHLVPAGY